MIEIVNMSREHLDVLAKLETACFSVPWSRSMIESELDNELAEYFVALEGGVIAGYGGSQTVLDITNITNIAVSPEYRRRGIAAKLMRQLIKRCGEKGVSELTLEVRESNTPAIALYASFGFITVGRRRRYYTLPDEDALIMTLFLGGAE